MKKLDKITEKELLKNYAMIDWKEIMAMRGIIEHHYFEVDADVVFQTLRDDLPLLRDALVRIERDMRN